MKKEKGIPSIIGILLLLVAIVGGVYLTNRQSSLQTKASGDCLPTSVQTTNLTHKSADISFTTSAACIANLQIDGKTYSDIRFVNSGKTEYPTKNHYFQIDNLSPDQGYKFLIISGGKNYNLASYSLLTGSTPSSTIPTSKLAWGKVFTPQMTPAANSIVYVNIPGALPLSSIVTSDGNWHIPLSVSLDESKKSWFSIPADTSEDIVVISEAGVVTQITNNTSNNNPVPNIIVGQDSFSTPTPIPQSSFTDSTSNHNISLSILNPKNLEVISSGSPDFFGKALPKSNVDIYLDAIERIVASVSVSDSGDWHWSPSSILSEGQHTLNVKNAQEQQTVIFTVNSLGSGDNNLAFTASGSATKTLPSPTIAPTATIFPTQTPLPTPTEVVRVSHPSTASGTPVSGSSNITVIIVLTSIVLTIFSYLWYLQ